MSPPDKTTFIFDFDSTIFPGESLDEIINYQLQQDPQANDKYEQIKTICRQGMSGEISMEVSLARRVQIAAPTQTTIAKYVRENKQRIDVNLQHALRQLQINDHQILVVSGGFEEWIRPLLEGVIPQQNIHANQIKKAALLMLFDNLVIRKKETIIKDLKYQNKIKGVKKIGQVFFPQRSDLPLSL